MSKWSLIECYSPSYPDFEMAQNNQPMDWAAEFTSGKLFEYE